MKSGGRKKGKPARQPVARRARSSKARSMRDISPSPASSFSTRPEDASLTRMLETLKPHDHLCLIYESHEEWRAAVVPFISVGLKRGEKCIYIVDTNTANEIRKHLVEEGVDVASAEKSGQLSILHKTEAFTTEGFFDPDKMIALLISEVEKAIAEGYSAIRGSDETTWVLHGYRGLERLLEYEAKLNRDFFPKYPCLAICQYDRWKFDPEIIKGVIMTHPLLIRGNNIYHNFYYIPTEEYLHQRRAEMEAQYCLHNLELERKTQETLRESEKRYRGILDNMLDGCQIIGFDWCYLYLNDVAASHGRRPKEELLGHTMMEIYPRIENTVMFAALRRCMEKRTLHRMENEFTFPDGSKGWFELSMEPVSEGVLILSRDITERKLVEEKVKQAMEELERSNAELERFVYVASHDLQEPLRMVSSFIQLLERRYKDKLDADANDFINYAVGGAGRMQELLNDLLVYSRVGTHAKPFARTDMEAVLEAALDNLQVTIEESKARVTHDPLPALIADEGQMVQVLQNLISNAVKFRGKKPPRIHVSAEQRDSEWVFSVKDNGIGIEPQHFDRIFLIFQRLYREEYPGTGTGLAIAKKIVELHGGRMWVESQPGKGSTFYFSIKATGTRQKAIGSYKDLISVPSGWKVAVGCFIS
jgi:chemotaxis family two-component system sensor kinase Cph1